MFEGRGLRLARYARYIWKVRILEVYVHHQKRSQRLCRTASDPSWNRPSNAGSFEGRTRKLDATNLQGKRMQTMSEPFLLDMGQKQTQIQPHKNRCKFLLTQQGECSRTARCLMEGIVLVSLATRRFP